MKKLLIVFLIASGCASQGLELPAFETREDAAIWITQNIKADSFNDIRVWGQEEYWQTPEETLLIHTGDCEDFSILMMYILKIQFGDSPEYAVFEIDDTNVYHAVVLNNKPIVDDNYVYDIIKYRENLVDYLKINSLEIYPYENIIFTAYINHNTIK